MAPLDAYEDMAKSAEKMAVRAQEEDIEIKRASGVIQQLEALSTELNAVVSNFKLE